MIGLYVNADMRQSPIWDGPSGQDDSTKIAPTAVISQPYSTAADQPTQINHQPTETTLGLSSGTTPPPKPLVGVEPNPGPFDQETVATPTVVTSTVSAQTLFKDGLHFIYSYLTTQEWCSAFQTYRLWLAAIGSEPSRHLLCPIDQDGNSRLILSTTITSATSPPHPPHPLLHHFTHLSDSIDCEGANLSIHELIQLMDIFTHLRRINICLRCNFTNSSLELMSVDQIRWPIHLTSLSIYFLTNDQHYHLLLFSIMRSCTRLKTLNLDGLPLIEENSPLPPGFSYHPFHELGLLSVLEELSIENNEGRPGVVIRLEDLEYLPQSIQRLYLRPLTDLSGMTRMTNVQFLQHSQLVLQPGQLQQLHALFPNLTLIHPRSFANQDLEVISQFKQCKEIEFCEFHDPSDPLLIDRLRTALIHTPSLTCIKDRYHQLWSVVIPSPELWSTDLSVCYLPNLIEISFAHSSGELVDALVNGGFTLQLKVLTLGSGLTRTDGALALDSLVKFVHLRDCSITLKGNWDTPPLSEFNSIRAYLDDPNRLPSLQRFELGELFGRVERFVWSKRDAGLVGGGLSRFGLIHQQVEGVPPVSAPLAEIETHPPAPPLVGIESNPGPLSQNTNPPSRALDGTNALTHPTPVDEVVLSPGPTTLIPFSSSCSHPSDLFTDGLLSIFQYLSFPDLLPAVRSCHHWYTCGLKERCRQLTIRLPIRYVAPPTTHAPSPLSLRFHVTRILLAIYQFPDLHASHFSSLQSIKCDDHGDDVLLYRFITSKPIPTSFIIPPTITSMAICPPRTALPSIWQTLIDRLPTSINLTTIRFVSLGEHQFNLSSLARIPTLTSVHMDQWMIHRSHTINWSKSLQRQCACLPLTIASFNNLHRPDWSIFHSKCPLLMKIESLNLNESQLSQTDWIHFTQHPPPHLRSLTCIGDANLPIEGLAAFNLNHLSLSIHSSYGTRVEETFTSILSSCITLTRLEVTGSVFTDDQLCAILNSLTQLDYLKLTDFSTQPKVRFLEYLPRHTIIRTKNLLTTSFKEFSQSVGHSNRLMNLEVTRITFTQSEPPTVDELIRLCQSVGQLEVMAIEFNSPTKIDFNYHRSATTSRSSLIH